MVNFLIFAAVALVGAVVVARRWNTGAGSGGGETGHAASDGAGVGSGSYYGDYLNRADGTWHDCGMQYGGGGADGAGSDAGGHDCDSGDGGADCGGDGGSD